MDLNEKVDRVIIEPVHDSKKVDLPCDIDIRDLSYNMPGQKDMAVCFVYFNASNSKRILMNLLYVQNLMQLSQIPTFIIEVYNTKPAIYKSFRIKSDSVLFHKERLCYLLEKQVPAKYTKLLFLDSDIIFANPNWYDELSTALDTYDIVHPYKKANWLDITYSKFVRQAESVMVNEANQTAIDYKWHVGFGWAFRREIFNKYGFYQYCIVGSGDSLSCMAWFKQSPERLITDMKNKYQYAAYEDFIKKVNPKPKMSHISGTVYHLYHGSNANRKYYHRHFIFKDVNDVRDILKEDESGLFEITDPELAQQVKDYFKDRDDDGV
jgi:hypothetical protein